MSRYEEQSPSYRRSMVESGRGHLLGEPHTGTHETLGTLAPWLRCLACHTEQRVKERDLCAACEQDAADSLAERDRIPDEPGSRCTAACGHCGRCGGA